MIAKVWKIFPHNLSPRFILKSFIVSFPSKHLRRILFYAYTQFIQKKMQAISFLLPFASAIIPDFGPDFVPSTADNMNGDYVFSSTPGGTPGLFPKRYADYPGGAEHFDVYSPPMTTRYSQVWWSPLAPAPFPADIVAKYAGKGMAIIGWEIDQVQKGVGPNGEDISVPINAHYNHHYVSQMIGAKARFRKVKLDGPDSPLGAKVMRNSGHGTVNWDQPQYIIEEIEKSSIPTHQQFSSANGGEYRKTYHGFPPGYALVVDSPTAMQLSPMQIDTWNRDAMNISGPGYDRSHT